MARRSEDIDEWVGRRIGEIRRRRGLTQAAMGQALQLSFQQVQKYESGTNRVSAARLFQLSRLLDCPVSSFFPEENHNLDLKDGPKEAAFEARALLAGFDRIHDASLRRSVVEVVEALALR